MDKLARFSLNAISKMTEAGRTVIKVGAMAMLVGTAALLAGCQSFVPSYDAERYRHLGLVADDVAKLKSAAVLSDDQLSYAKAETYYVDALANLDEAEPRLAARRQDHDPSMQASALQRRAMEDCRSALKLLIARNKAGPISATLIDDLALAVTCGVPHTMEGRLNRTEA